MGVAVMKHGDGFAWTGVKGPLRLEDVLFQAKKANRLAPLQVVRADRVVGADHLATAAFHAKRAFDEGRNKAERLEVEFVRYLAGKRTIKEALNWMGVQDGAEAGVVIAFGDEGEKAVEYFAEMLGLITDDSVADANPAKLANFGINRAAIDATTPGRELDLALEAVAAVDLARS